MTTTALIAAGALLFASTRQRWTVVFDPAAMNTIAVGGIVVAVAVVVSVVEAATEMRVRWAGTLVALPVVGVLSTVALVASRQSSFTSAVSARETQGAVAVPETPSETTAETAAPTSGSAVPVTLFATSTAPRVVQDRWNILLLGGDAGPGRFSLRTDSMTVVSIDPATLDVAMVSVPRNLFNLPLPSGPLQDVFGPVFSDLANALYPRVNSHPDMFPARVSDDPGADAISAGVAELLGVEIDDWVLVDMAGFIDVIDALGGIDVTVTKRIPAAGNVRSAKHDLPEYFEKGRQHLDGTLALSYARSRHADSDYSRMQRQRCLLVETVRQKSGVELIGRYSDVTAAIGRSVRSTLSASNIAVLLEMAGQVDVDSARTLVLVPPLIKPSAPDVPAIRAMVGDLLRPTRSSGGSSEPSGSSSTTSSWNTAPTDTSTGDSASAAVTVGEACVS